MNKQDRRVELEKLKDGIVELRYYDRPKISSYLYWQIPINEAVDLAKWWLTDGVQIRKEDIPVLHRRCGNVLISMFTHTRIDVRGSNQHGGLRLLGYSMPRKVVECLSVWLQDGQHTPKLNTGKNPK